MLQEQYEELYSRYQNLLHNYKILENKIDDIGMILMDKPYLESEVIRKIERIINERSNNITTR